MQIVVSFISSTFQFRRYPFLLLKALAAYLIKCHENLHITGTPISGAGKIQTALIFVMSLTLLSACSGGGGGGPPDPTTTATAAIARVIAPGAECATGGVEIATGVDENGNGEIDNSEIDNTEIVCNGAAGSDSMVTFSPMLAGQECEFGGLSIDTGYDDNNDDQLQDSEITDSGFLCNPAAEIFYPSIVGAIATSNTTITVSFSKEMGPSVVLPGNYRITQAYANAEVGTLFVTAVRLLTNNGEPTSVELSTSPQNEVTYQIQGSSLTDIFGTALPGLIETLGGLLDTSRINFAGSAPTIRTVFITLWTDTNNNSLVDAGDTVSNDQGFTVVLNDIDSDGIVDNWNDNDNSGTVTPVDTVTGFLDSDGDGLPDHQETYGTTVTIELANLDTETISVTSDPYLADTDNDGLNDLDEISMGSNPRKADTDSDGLSDNLEANVINSSPNSQDTDQDSLLDGLEHNFYHTSPLLADSDGDNLDDDVELNELNRNPKIADLPALGISVGEVRLQIDERYTFVDESGETVTRESSSSSSLANSQNTSFSRSVSGVDEWAFEIGGRAGVGNGSFFGGDAGFSGGVEITASGGETHTSGWQSDKSSAQESQQIYENSINKGREFTETSSVTREVAGARIDIDLSLTNNGNIPFTVRNLEVSVLQQAGQVGKFIPVATLVSNSELITGTSLEVNLGAFTNERGPFLFASREVFPNLVEQLMRNPGGLKFEVVNFDIVDELGRNFTFVSQVARDRTGGVTIDFGDAENARQYLVSTNGVIDDEGVSGGGYLGGFNASDGSPLGLPIGYVLQGILGIPRHDNALDQISAGNNFALDSVIAGDDLLLLATALGDVITTGPDGILDTPRLGDDIILNPSVPSGILAGLNKIANSIAIGDDIQLVPVDTTGLTIGTIVVDPGENGVLDTPTSGDDQTGFVRGFETSSSCSVSSNKAGNICRFDSDCECALNDPDLRCNLSPSPAGICDGPEKLVRVNTMRNGDFNRGWVVLTSNNREDAADFRQITLEPGHDMIVAFLQDLDKDGLFARNEFLQGSTDSSADNFDNSGFGIGFDPDTDAGADGLADSKDTDRDGLGDYNETFIGWRVSADGGNLRQVLSSPRFPDSDGDGLSDLEEQDLRSFCVQNDPRNEALCGFQSDHVLISEAIGIIAGQNGNADSVAAATDEQLIPVGEVVSFGTAIVGPGNDGSIETALSGDDLYESLSTIPPATDPSSSDTDLDGISDFVELNGFSAGLAMIDGGNGIAEAVKNGDDIQRAFPGNAVFPGGIVMLPGANGIIDSTTAQRIGSGDDESFEIVPGLTVIGCGLNGISDTVITEGSDIQATPYGDTCPTSGWFPNTAVVAPAAFLLQTIPNNIADDRTRPATAGLTTDPLRRDTDTDNFPDGLEVALGSNPTVIDADDFVDSDLDGLTDKEESLLGWLVSVDGGVEFNVNPSPFLPDTDFDGLPDIVERDLRTNPNNVDTDGDGIHDFDEVADLSAYAALAALYPGLNIIAGPTGGYGTDPALSDTDGDGLSDKQELRDGFRLLIPGTLDAIHVYTNPVYADTDLDGQNDGDEVNRAGGPTNPTVADTDDDGRSDGQEFIAGTDPFVADRSITVQYAQLKLKGGHSGSAKQWGWDFRIQLPGESFPGVNVTTEENWAWYVHSQWVETGGNCSYVPRGNLDTFSMSTVPGASTTFTLTEGQNFILHGTVHETNHVLTPPGSTNCTMDMYADFREVISYDDIAISAFQSNVIQTRIIGGISTNNQEIIYEITVQ